MLEAFLTPTCRNQNNASDSDSDLEELQGDIAKFDESVREFLSSHRGPDASSRPIRGGPRGRGTRGPRKAVKPRGDITARLSKVNQAFLNGDYSKALDLVSEVIRINAETHQAWTALSSIFQEQGETKRALSAMVYATHLRPKDVSGWLGCASYALDTAEDDEAGNLQTARLCYSAALRADPTNVEARIGKATVCHRQGHLAAAISEYNNILKHHPRDLDIVRKLAEACVDNKHADSALPSAIAAYKRYFDHEMTNPSLQELDGPWHDVGIYVELFASAGRYHDAIRELKALARWLMGRASEHYWDQWQEDDREWDDDDERRSLVPDYVAGRFASSFCGTTLPHDLRVRLAIYRLRLGDSTEALVSKDVTLRRTYCSMLLTSLQRHLTWLEPEDQRTSDFFNDFPFLAYDLADELSQCGQPLMAIRYFEMLRAIPGDLDAMLLLQLGRCHLANGEQSIAEEYFLTAIEIDEASIDARIELANMYEKAKEDEEALILAAEAIAIRKALDHPLDGEVRRARSQGYILPTQLEINPRQRQTRIGARAHTSKRGITSSRSVLPRRYRPKRLAGPDQRRQDDQARAIKLSHQYEAVRGLKQEIVAGRDDLVHTWMASSKELIDDFRSLKRFYTWDKYLHFIGQKPSLERQPYDQTSNELSQLYERLARCEFLLDTLPSAARLFRSQ